MTTKHREPAYKDRVANAPYNFVPLPEDILTVAEPLPSHDCYDPQLLTGKLTCTLTTESPLYVRAARTWQQYKNDQIPSEPFYGESVETLLIPGSSLRGMLRNLVEIVSCSRISPTSKQPLFFRTVEVSSVGRAYGKRMTGGDAGQQGWITLSKAGYMELIHGDYFIRPALEYFGTQHFRIQERVAQKVIRSLQSMANPNEQNKWRPSRDYRWLRCKIWFQPTAPASHLPESPTFFAEVDQISTSENKPEGDGWVSGWFIASGWVPSPKGGRGKHRHWIVGPPNPDDTTLMRVEDEDIELYKERTGGRTQAIEKMDMSVIPQKEGEAIPCFYTSWTDEDNQPRLAFGHTGMFRLPYQKTPADMLPDNLKQSKGYDLAEALFGFVDQVKSARGAVAGRVFVTDATLIGEYKHAVADLITMSDQALSGPKPTTFQHYLTQDKPDDSTELRHYDNDPNTETNLRGHKLYWHVGSQADFNQRLARAPQLDTGTRSNDKGNRFKPVKKGQSFNFDIRFENLRSEELGALLWVLDKANEKSKYRFKIGMGKPYGFGSVAIDYEIRLEVRGNRYKDLVVGDTWHLGEMEKTEVDKKATETLSAFSRFVLDNRQVNPGKVNRIDDLPRIKEMLALLTWEGRPREDLTRYMQLEEFTGKREPIKNPRELGRRPVLPSASKVLAFDGWYPNLPPKAPKPSGSRPDGYRNAPPTTVAPRHGPVPEQRVKQAPPTRRERQPEEPLPEAVEKEPKQYKVGDHFWAVTEDEASAKSDVTLLLPHVDAEVAFAVIPADKHPLRRFKKNERVLLRINAIRGNEKEGFEFVCEPVKQ